MAGKDEQHDVWCLWAQSRRCTGLFSFLLLSFNQMLGPRYPYECEIWTAISVEIRAGRGILSVYLRVDLVKKRVQNANKSGNRSESSLEACV